MAFAILSVFGREVGLDRASFFTYVLQSESTGRFYIGFSADVERRVSQHNDPGYRGSKTTKRFAGPWKLVFVEGFATRAAAMQREKQLKRWKSRRSISELIDSDENQLAEFRLRRN